MPAIFAFIVYLFGWGISGWPHRYDAPIPQRCATADVRFTSVNKDWCDAWFDDHRKHRGE